MCFICMKINSMFVCWLCNKLNMEKAQESVLIMQTGSVLTIKQCQKRTSLMKDSPVSDLSGRTLLTSNLLPVNSNSISDHEVKEVTE